MPWSRSSVSRPPCGPALPPPPSQRPPRSSLGAAAVRRWEPPRQPTPAHAAQGARLPRGGWPRPGARRSGLAPCAGGGARGSSGGELLQGRRAGTTGGVARRGRSGARCQRNRPESRWWWRICPAASSSVSRAATLSGSREVTPARDSLGDGRGSLVGSRQGLTREESARQAVPTADLSAGAAWFQSRAWRATALRGWAVRRATALASGWMVRGGPCSAVPPSRDRAEGAASQGVETAVRGGAGRGRA